MAQDTITVAISAAPWRLRLARLAVKVLPSIPIRWTPDRVEMVGNAFGKFVARGVRVATPAARRLF